MAFEYTLSRADKSAFTMSTFLLFGSTILTMATMSGNKSIITDDDTLNMPSGDMLTFCNILLQNVSACLLIFSGVISLGVISFMSLLLVGIVLGIQIGSAIEILGIQATISHCWMYTPFEILGILLAGTAGFSVLFRKFFSETKNYTLPESLTHALHIFALSLLSLSIGAGLEILSIHINHWGNHVDIQIK